jgi:transcriptional regulator with GAF, ATPase, and Fis domain
LPWIKSKAKQKITAKTNTGIIRKNNAEKEEVQLENELLKKRILETSDTFFSQAQFFNSLLTLNEMHLIQAVVESSAQFLNASRTSFYQFCIKDHSFTKSVSYSKTEGLQLEVESCDTDRILNLIKESRSILTIREILHNEMLYKQWQSSISKALLYCPIFLGKHFIGILTVDKIKFHHLNRQTVKNLMVISKLTASAFKNVRDHHRIIAEKNKVQSQILSEYQDFLKTFNLEFKRAHRNELQLSLIYIVLESRTKDQVFNKEGVELIKKIKSSCKKNLREIDLFFDDMTPGRCWILLPMTDFSGLAFVLERLNLLINMDLASQSNYLCHLGFSSFDQEIKQPKQMMETCKESFHLHRTVRTLLTKNKEYDNNQTKSKSKSKNF